MTLVSQTDRLGRTLLAAGGVEKLRPLLTDEQRSAEATALKLVAL